MSKLKKNKFNGKLRYSTGSNSAIYIGFYVLKTRTEWGIHITVMDTYGITRNIWKPFL
jgi:hypothetical protein